MNESMMTRLRDVEVRCFEIRIQPPPGVTRVGQTCRLPFERIKPYLTGPSLRIQPWRRPDRPPPAK